MKQKESQINSGYKYLLYLIAHLFTSSLSLAGEIQPDFRTWVSSIWPEVEAAGISRLTFDTALGNITPNLKIPDLNLPNQKRDANKGQAEFTVAPGDYLNESYLDSLAKKGRILAVKHKTALERIESEIGVDRYSILAIWGRETAFGQYKLPYDALEVLATLAWTGRRKELFHTELIEALKMLQSGVQRSDMRSSWAGALGLTQLMPSEYFKYARDNDGDGKIDIFNSVPDALASAAAQLKGKGWVRLQPWGYEVTIPHQSNCSLEGPTQSRSVSMWAQLGFKRADGQEWDKSITNTEGYLMSPAGTYGPSFLVFENFKVFRKYNTSDLYAVFVGHLANQIAGNGDFKTPFTKIAEQRNAIIEEIQIALKNKGYRIEKIDGKIGSNTRMYVGLYQQKNRLKIDCWPSQKVLDHMKRSTNNKMVETL